MAHRVWGKLRQYIGILSVAVIASLILKTFVVDAMYVPSPSMENSILPGDYVVVNKLIHGPSAPNHLPFTTASLPFFHLPSLHSVRRGDVIVFDFPSADEEGASCSPPVFVKRCAAIAGDEIEIRGGILRVNGRVERELSPQGATAMEDFGPRRVPKRGDVIRFTADNYEQWASLIRQESHSVERSSSGGVMIDGTETATYILEKNYLFVLGDNQKQSYDSRSWGYLCEDRVIGKAMMIYWSIVPSRSIRSLADCFSAVRWNRLGSFVY